MWWRLWQVSSRLCNMFCGFVPDCPRSETLSVECRDERSTMIEGLGRLTYQNVLVGPRSRTGDSR